MYLLKDACRVVIWKKKWKYFFRNFSACLSSTSGRCRFTSAEHYALKEALFPRREWGCPVKDYRDKCLHCSRVSGIPAQVLASCSHPDTELWESCSLWEKSPALTCAALINRQQWNTQRVETAWSLVSPNYPKRCQEKVTLTCLFYIPQPYKSLLFCLFSSHTQVAQVYQGPIWGLIWVRLLGCWAMLFSLSIFSACNTGCKGHSHPCACCPAINKSIDRCISTCLRPCCPLKVSLMICCLGFMSINDECTECGLLWFNRQCLGPRALLQ